MKLSIDLERFLDTATVDDYVKVENPGTSIEWMKEFWAQYLVVDGEKVEVVAAEAILGGLTLRQFRELRREGELRDLAVPPMKGSD